MKFSVSVVAILAVVSLAVSCPPVLAHNLWLNPENYYPEVGTTVDIGIGWGHTYPANRVDQEVKEGRVEAISAVDPDGQTVELAKASTALYKLTVEKAGAYLIIARIKPGVFTMTPEGRKWGDKQTVANAVKCTNFHLEAKTVIIAGGSDKNLSYPAGQPLEVILLTSPHELKGGDQLPVRVLFEGKPLSGASIRATYAGFEEQDMAPHNAASAGGKSHHGHFPAEALTDGQGQALLPMGKSGFWMIMLSHKPPYPDAEVCDEYMYNTAFTFQVQ